MECPACHQPLEVDPLDELECLHDLRRRVKGWQAEGALPPAAATKVLELAARDQLQIEHHLAGATPPATAPSPDPAASAPYPALPLPPSPALTIPAPASSRPAFSWS